MGLLDHVGSRGWSRRNRHVSGSWVSNTGSPPEVWNRLGTKILPKLRSGDDLSVGIEFSVSVDSAFGKNMESELRQILDDLGLAGSVRIERHEMRIFEGSSASSSEPTIKLVP